MANEEKITVVAVHPQQRPEVIEIEDTLERLQKFVGGYIQVVYPFEDNVGLVCNDDGKFDGSPLNRALRDDNGKIYDIIAGSFLIVGLTEDSFGSLTQAQQEKFVAFFETPEMFLKVAGRLVVLPC